ncbi:uncharacterized protein EHS24_002695 [Apiotrichum porosum]|uniref:ThuA-like domain-containing protein n=1 Tax=Apiotrichum porosum TaxID=105984 RepID=A0A427XH70_9TREE|nr:uncharacterized protein EHS24_002695 [Apiotrichum porosum]RSH78231.1 hypothetical protein EHS24_002695 [Apiotrichum porosum]
MPSRAAAVSATAGTPKVLVYTATAGYRHDSIPTAIQVLGDHASDYGVDFVFSENASLFVDDTLSGFDGVMFVSNSDEVLDNTQQGALQRFFQNGGVYTGVHAASACLFNDTTYLQAVGALFDYHPEIQQATFERLNTTHPATAPVPDKWTFEEEVYYFRSDPRSVGATVLMTVDESSYVNNGTSTGSYPSMDDPHPIAWYIESPESALPLADGAPKAGRSFYTSLGHLNSTWENSTFIEHVFGGLTWALDGASTKAYGVGLVGNANGTVSNSTNTTVSASTAPVSSGASATTSAGAEASTTAAKSSSAGRTLAAAGGVLGAAALAAII